MKRNRPKLAAGTTIQIGANPARPDLAQGDRAIRTGDDREALPIRAGRTLLGLLIGGALLAAAVAAILSATVMVALSAGDHRAVVLRNAYPTDAVPSGALVYASSAPAATSMLGHIEEAVAGVPAGAVVQIIAGPNADVATDKTGVVTVNGKPTAFTAKVSPARLRDQYVALCIAGSGCQPGAAVTIGQDNVIGSVRGYLTLTGLTPVPTPVPIPAR